MILDHLDDDERDVDRVSIDDDVDIFVVDADDVDRTLRHRGRLNDNHYKTLSKSRHWRTMAAKYDFSDSHCRAVNNDSQW